MLQPVHQAMQARKTPYRDHPQCNGYRDDDGTAENIGELHLTVVGDGQRKMRMEKQAGGERPGSGGHQRREEFVPQRHLIVPAQGLGKDKRGGYRRAKQRPDGAGGGQNRPVQRANAREKTRPQEDRQRDVDRHNGVLRPEAHAAGEADNQRDDKPRQGRRRNGRANQWFQRRIRPGVSRAIADHQPYGNPGQGQHHHDPTRRVNADAKLHRQRRPQQRLQHRCHLHDDDEHQARRHANNQRRDGQ